MAETAYFHCLWCHQGTAAHEDDRPVYCPCGHRAGVERAADCDCSRCRPARQDLESDEGYLSRLLWQLAARTEQGKVGWLAVAPYEWLARVGEVTVSVYPPQNGKTEVPRVLLHNRGYSRGSPNTRVNRALAEAVAKAVLPPATWLTKHLSLGLAEGGT